MTEVTQRQQEVLGAIQKGTNTTSALAGEFGVTYSAISSMIRRLEDNGLVTRADDGAFVVTSDGKNMGNQSNRQGGTQQANQGGQQDSSTPTGRPRGTDTKIAQAEQIFGRFFGKEARKQILERFKSELGLTDAGASTYYQKLRGEHGYANQNAGGQGANRGRGDGRSANTRAAGNRGNQGGNRGRSTANRGAASNRGGASSRGGQRASR